MLQASAEAVYSGSKRNMNKTRFRIWLRNVLPILLTTTSIQNSTIATAQDSCQTVFQIAISSNENVFQLAINGTGELIGIDSNRIKYEKTY